MYEKEKEDIRKLSEKIGDIDNQARRQGRPLNATEAGIRAELEDRINEIRMRLPTSDPLTLQGPDGRRSAAPAGGFSNKGEFFQAVYRAGMPGGKIDQRLYAAASGLNESVPSEGGFLVQQDFSNDLLLGAYQQAVIAPLCKRIQISGNSNGIKINAFDETSRVSTRFGGILSYWAAEAEEKTKSKPKFRQLELSLKKLIGLCYASDELLQDVSVLNTVLPAAFASEFAFRVDDAIINGTGAGQPLGIINSGALVTVDKETGQMAETIVAENLIKMYSRQINPGAAFWFVNKSVFPQLYTLSLSVGTGGAPIFQPAGGLSAAPYNTLLGRPVFPIEQAAVLGTVGDILFADVSDGYVLAEKGGMQTDVSIHVRFIYDESVFRFVYRVDGQPVRASALTPYKGGAGNTQSHFVALATRA